jgi:hypothetical protein
MVPKMVPKMTPSTSSLCNKDEVDGDLRLDEDKVDSELDQNEDDYIIFTYY